MENKLKIVFAGSPKSSSTILQSLIDNSNVEVPYVISQEPKRAKRGNKLLPTEVAIKATENDIDLLEPRSSKCHELAGMREGREEYGGVYVVACSNSQHHANLPVICKQTNGRCLFEVLICDTFCIILHREARI